MLERRPSRPDDEAFLRGVYASTRANEISLFGWHSSQAEIFLRMQFDAQDRHYRAAYPDARFDIVELDGVAIGRFYVARLPGMTHVVDISLLPPWRGQGHGTELLRGLQRDAARDGAGISMHVEGSNPAQRLYERLGFRVTGDAGPYKMLEWRA
ncbi:GNAT family N-acetyltransferase [Rugamonas sp. FT107W]|uniref:GNAT family N-acetyltransferase n=1 Tax=Duganella vulcania TaxID=2692166 RepID=A0A845HFG7_9BURK|nr:GNAT family N-acetyltransferase [Duganella vulcania]MYN15684.1 GNAT family N-acetyltransferase [Duganella vulcania]